MVRNQLRDNRKGRSRPQKLACSLFPAIRLDYSLFHMHNLVHTFHMCMDCICTAGCYTYHHSFWFVGVPEVGLGYRPAQLIRNNPLRFPIFPGPVIGIETRFHHTFGCRGMDKLTISYVHSDMPGKDTGFKENEVTIRKLLLAYLTPNFSL